MAKLEYFIVCERTSVDVETNSISLFHVLEDLFPDEFPYTLPRLEAVSLWILGPGDEETDFQATLKVFLPGEETGVPFPMNLSKGRMRYRTVLVVLDIPLNKPGELKIEVLLNNVHAADHTVTVHDIGTPKVGEEIQMRLPIK
jgi:hypothetical protein